jgi:protein ImuB
VSLKLWLCLSVPHLPLEIYTRGDFGHEPLAILNGGPGRYRTLVACNPPALALGVRPGMTRAAAHALLPGLRILPRDESEEKLALERIAAWAGQFTSLVSLAAPCSVLLEAAGSLRLFGGAEALLRKVKEEAGSLGYDASLALAPTPLGACLLNRFGLERCVLDLRELRRELAPVPLPLLQLSEEILESLRGLGLNTLGECLRLPREGLAKRFGPGLIDYLDRLLGNMPDPRLPFEPPPRFQARLALPAEAASCEALLFPLRRLVLELTGFLSAKEGAIQRLEVNFGHRQAVSSSFGLELVAPSRNPRYLLELLRERLERVELPEPVQAVGLAAGEVLRLGLRNQDLFGEEARQNEGWQRLVERLGTRLGKQAVRGLRALAEHRPERAWSYCSPGEGTPKVELPPRPLWLLDDPLLLPILDGRPYLQGVLSLHQGPERIESGWWDGADVARDYYVAVQPEGFRLWVFREREGERRWFLHGIFG